MNHGSLGAFISEWLYFGAFLGTIPVFYAFRQLMDAALRSYGQSLHFLIFSDRKFGPQCALIMQFLTIFGRPGVIYIYIYICKYINIHIDATLDITYLPTSSSCPTRLPDPRIEKSFP